MLGFQKKAKVANLLNSSQIQLDANSSSDQIFYSKLDSCRINRLEKVTRVYKLIQATRLALPTLNKARCPSPFLPLSHPKMLREREIGGNETTMAPNRPEIRLPPLWPHFHPLLYPNRVKEEEPQTWRVRYHLPCPLGTVRLAFKWQHNRYNDLRIPHL